MQRGNTLCCNPQRRRVRRGGRSARKIVRWTIFSGGRAAAQGKENFSRERRRPDVIFFPYALAAREGRMARQARAKGGAEQSVSPVGCSPKGQS